MVAMLRRACASMQTADGNADYSCWHRALEEAEGLILSCRKALREAEQNSKDAESR